MAAIKRGKMIIPVMLRKKRFANARTKNVQQELNRFIN
jgi:hypothetical protein